MDNVADYTVLAAYALVQVGGTVLLLYLVGRRLRR
jgi:hypothetical protein